MPVAAARRARPKTSAASSRGDPAAQMAEMLDWFHSPPCHREAEVVRGMFAAAASVTEPRPWCAAAAVPGAPEDVDDTDVPSPFAAPPSPQTQPLAVAAPLAVSDRRILPKTRMPSATRAALGKRPVMQYRRGGGGASCLRDAAARSGQARPALTSFYTPYEKWGRRGEYRPSVDDRLISSAARRAEGDADAAFAAYGCSRYQALWAKARHVTIAVARLRRLFHRRQERIHQEALVPRGGRLLSTVGTPPPGTPQAEESPEASPAPPTVEARVETLTRELRVSKGFAMMLADSSPEHEPQRRDVERPKTGAPKAKGGFAASDFVARSAHLPGATKGKRCQLLVTETATTAARADRHAEEVKVVAARRAASARAARTRKGPPGQPEAFGAGAPAPLSEQACRLIRGDERGRLVNARRQAAADHREAARRHRAMLRESGEDMRLCTSDNATTYQSATALHRTASEYPTELSTAMNHTLSMSSSAATPARRAHSSTFVTQLQSAVNFSPPACSPIGTLSRGTPWHDPPPSQSFERELEYSSSSVARLVKTPEPSMRYVAASGMSFSQGLNASADGVNKRLRKVESNAAMQAMRAQDAQRRFQQMQEMKEAALQDAQDQQVRRIAYARELKRSIPEREAAERARVFRAAVHCYQFLALGIALKRQRLMHVVVRTKLRAWIERFRFRKAKARRTARLQPKLSATRPTPEELSSVCFPLLLFTTKGVVAAVQTLVLEFLPAGDHLAHQRDPILRARFLTNGHIEVGCLAVNGGGGAKPKSRAVGIACSTSGLSRLNEGEMMDWAALVTAGGRSMASAVCRSDTALWTLKTTAFAKLLAQQPQPVRKRCAKLQDMCGRAAVELPALTPSALKKALRVVGDVAWDAAELDTLCQEAVPKYYADRAPICAEGEPGDELYVISAGMVVLHRKAQAMDFALPPAEDDPDHGFLVQALKHGHMPPDERFLTVLFPGAGVGEYACVPAAQTPRMCTVAAFGGCRVWVISKQEFQLAASRSEARQRAVQRALYELRVGRMPRGVFTPSLFRSHPWFSAVGEQEAAVMAEEAIPILCEAGETAVAAGQPITSIYIATAGLLMPADPDAKSIATDGRWKGLTQALIDPAACWPYELMTPTAAEVWRVPAQLVQMIVKNGARREQYAKVLEDAKAALDDAGIKMSRKASRAVRDAALV
eukprot:TRINITY_DN27923_c0_g1_i1.p1 TRINITY_DN27923_c0_g1~~TRINITY_DN27923_c0_g1_i1.p1  ORF type:complete len:1181 (+),score=355.03 TRINITY_DN27923_c0_g1_i1:88-3630(+)